MSHASTQQMVTLGDPPYSSQISCSIPFKWEIEPGVPKQAPPLLPRLQLRPPPAGISLPVPEFSSVTPPSLTESKRSRQRILRHYSKNITITSDDELPTTGRFARRMPSPSPPRPAFFASPPFSLSSSSSSVGGGSPDHSERMPGCFPIPSLLKRKGVKGNRIAKSTANISRGSDFNDTVQFSPSARSFRSFRESPRHGTTSVSFSSFRKSPVGVADLEWATYGLF